MSSAAISRTALRARPLVLAQSAPPRRCSAGDSPPTYLVTSSSWSVGTYSRSGGCPRLAAAYSRTRYSRVAPAAVLLVISTNPATRPPPVLRATRWPPPPRRGRVAPAAPPGGRQPPLVPRAGPGGAPGGEV